MKLDGVAAFVAVAEAGSISGAARQLGLSKSVVSEVHSELHTVTWPNGADLCREFLYRQAAQPGTAADRPQASGR